jgi:hypothetical protein
MNADEHTERPPTVAAMTFSERAVETKLAQAICRSDDGPGVPSCVMDAHPERDPCDDKNCRRLAQARAVLAALAVDGLALVPSHHQR